MRTRAECRGRAVAAGTDAAELGAEVGRGTCADSILAIPSLRCRRGFLCLDVRHITMQQALKRIVLECLASGACCERCIQESYCLCRTESRPQSPLHKRGSLTCSFARIRARWRCACCLLRGACLRTALRPLSPCRKVRPCRMKEKFHLRATIRFQLFGWTATGLEFLAAVGATGSVGITAVEKSAAKVSATAAAIRSYVRRP